MFVRQIISISGEITALDKQLIAWHAKSEASRRLAAIPGLGIVMATAIASLETGPLDEALAPDGSSFMSPSTTPRASPSSRS
jgi:transposase